jgi:hypothetical protein
MDGNGGHGGKYHSSRGQVCIGIRIHVGISTLAGRAVQVKIRTMKCNSYPSTVLETVLQTKRVGAFAFDRASLGHSGAKSFRQTVEIARWLYLLSGKR